MRWVAMAALVGATIFSTSAGAVFSYSSLVARDRAHALKGQCGPSAPWRGSFSGQRYDSFVNELTPYGDQGCFASEADCRFWQQLNFTVLNGGPVRVTSCRP